MPSKIIKILKAKSTKYILFRSKYELERKLGVLSWAFPTKMTPVKIPSLEYWKGQGCGWLFDNRESLSIPKQKSHELKEKMEHYLKGDVLFFNKTWKSLGLKYDWVTNPETNYQYDVCLHWTKVNDFSEEAGDIKFVWEKSRFSWLLDVCRYDYHFDENHAEFAIGQILDWIEKNPLNCGPNYKCSQEISIRMLNWLFALNFYKNSDALTEERWKKIITSIYWQTDHVMKNINFSRIAVRNNHAITETLTLYLMGLMFPMMPGAVRWRKNGKRWFEIEIDYQIENDGSYIQDSMNYHRVVIQLLTYAIALADRHSEQFSDFVYDKAYKSVNFLYQCQELSNGWLPNYGANDGALFFPMSDTDYRDYRPQLDSLHILLTDKALYTKRYEDSYWVGMAKFGNRKVYPKIERQNGIVRFEKSGYYLIREKDTLTFIRCGLFKKKGSRDQLHVDLWYRGNNVLMDSGSYMYNTNEEIVRYFSGTESHNSVMIGNYDQMKKGMRFMWIYPPTFIFANLTEGYFDYMFVGCVKAFKSVGENGVTLHRSIKKIKGCAEWEIIDTIEGAPTELPRRQLWHYKSDGILFISDGEKVEKPGWYSDYYGVKEENRQIEFVTKGNKIKTKIKIIE